MSQGLEFQREPNKEQIQFTHILYGLQGASFFFGITFIVALVMAYVKRDDVKGTWLESHFDWQIKTFWLTLIGTVIGTILLIVLIGYFVIIAVYIWSIYRVVKGWMYLNDGKVIS